MGRSGRMRREQEPSHASDRQRQAVLDALAAQIAVLDAAGRITAVNEAWRRFARENGGGQKVETGVGMDYLQACLGRSDTDPEGVGLQAHSGIRAVIHGDKDEFSLEYPCHSPDRQRWFLMTVTPLGAELGGAVVAHMDISARVLAEQESRRRREEVAHHARLSSVTVLAGALVHELAQPLAAASLYGESLVALVRRDPVDRVQLLAVLEDLRSQVHRAIGIVGGLRRFMRRGELQTEPCELEAPIREAMALVAPLARRKSIRMELEMPTQPVRVRVNSLQIEQVLVNLLCNGVEAIDRAGSAVRNVRIEVGTADHLATVTVADSGPGLSAEWAPRIFEVFETEKKTGMGMGLAVSRTIVEAHGGRLWAESGNGEGAVLRFTVPLHEESAPT